VGRLVHRAWQADLDAAAGTDALVAQMETLVTDEDRAGADSLAAALATAAGAYSALAARDDVRTLLAGGVRDHEVPFSLRLDEGVIIRGVIDCLVRSASGLTVLELKTGGPVPEHEAQLDLYVRAAEALSGGRPVSGRLIYV